MGFTSNSNSVAKSAQGVKARPVAIMGIALLVFCWILLCPTLAPAVEVYSWTDSKGVKHFGDLPPTGTGKVANDVSKLSVKPSGVDTSRVSDNEFVVMDFNDNILHDSAWLKSRPVGTVETIVSPKSDSGVDKLSLAVGEGRNGTNALLVQSDDSKAGLPGFWVTRFATSGGGNVYDSRGYILPTGRRANRLEMWVKFPAGYRAKRSAAVPPTYPNHQNLHVGTYQFDPNQIGQNRVVESNNWHFYYQLWLRHDKANGDWIKITLNEMPSHQRGLNAAPQNNPTLPSGNFWELLTRFYVDGTKYFSDPEIAYPVKLLVDDIKLTYSEESSPIQIQFVVGSRGGDVDVARGTDTKIQMLVLNNSNKEACGRIEISSPPFLHSKLFSEAANTPVPPEICVKPAKKLPFNLTVNPDDSVKSLKRFSVGVTFVERKYISRSADSSNPTRADSRVEKRWYDYSGPFDAPIASDFVRVTVQ